MSLARNFSIVGSATLASRLTGFLRDMLVAAVLGASAVADAYVAAFLIPNLFRRLVGEGAFNAAYVPIFARRDQEHGAQSAQAFAEAALSLMLGVGIAILLAAEFLMPQIISGLAPGFAPSSARFADAVAYGQIMFPFVAIVLITAVFNGTLNALGRYAIAAWSPVLLNILLIGALLYALTTGLRGTRDAGFVLVWTVLIGGLINLAIVAIAVWWSGYRLSPFRPALDADVRRLFIIALPGIAIAGAGHINMVVAAQLSSSIPSAVSWLYFAERIFQLPLGFVASAIGVVLLPAVARHMASGDTASVQHAESRAMEFGLLITLPAAIGLAVLATPIVSVLYQRGAFTAEDASAVAAVLRALAIGLPAFVLVKVMLPAFLAREDIRTPLVAAFLGVSANIATTLVLMPRHGALAAAIGVSVSAIINAVLLWVILIRRGHFRMDGLARIRVPRIVAVSALTGLCIVALDEFSRPYLKMEASFPVRLAVLSVVCGVAVLAQVVLAYLVRAIDFSEVRLRLKRAPDS